MASEQDASKKHTWTRDEMIAVLNLYPNVRSKLHERNPEIKNLAERLGVSTRAVEAQLLMFRALEREGFEESYSWNRMSKVAREVWNERYPSSGASASPPPIHASTPMGFLERRSFGGEKVAAQPDLQDEEDVPTLPILPAVEHAITEAVEHHESPTGLFITFMIGGAGNGKSFAAREMLRRMGVPLSGEALAQRIYQVEGSACDVFVLNDATIAERSSYGGDQAVALACDLKRWIAKARTKPVIALCCVNRGIIIDELQSIIERPNDFHGVVHAILKWCVTGDWQPDLGPGDHASSQQDGSNVVKLSSEGDFNIRLRSIAVDNFSVLHDSGSSHQKLTVNEGNEAPDYSPTCDAESLLQQVLARAAGELSSRPSHCPIAGNLRQFAAESATRAWINLLRRSEVASGKLLTYRDIWGLVSLSILGPRTAGGSATDGSIVSKVDTLLEQLNSIGNTQPTEKLDILLSLAGHRLHQAIFRGASTLSSGAVRRPVGFPAASGLMLLDPASHASDGAAAVEEAMGALILNEKPSKSLRSSCAKFTAAWTDFDNCLEDAIIAVTSDDRCDDVRRRQLASWLSAYILRAHAFAIGSFGNSATIDTLVDCRRMCSAGPCELPFHLAPAIRDLVFPRFSDEFGSRTLVRAYAPRSEPLSSSFEESRALLFESIETRQLSFLLKADGHRLALEIRDSSRSVDDAIAKTNFDFNLVREALIWTQGQAGLTEATRLVEPRLERLRSSSITSAGSRSKKFGVLLDGRPYDVCQV